MVQLKFGFVGIFLVGGLGAVHPIFAKLISIAPDCLDLLSQENREVREVLRNLPDFQHPTLSESLPLRGSGRQFFRVSGYMNGKPTKALLMAFKRSRSDSRKFVGVADYLNRIGIAVPEIYDRNFVNGFNPRDRTHGYILMEDLGKWTLKDAVKATGGLKEIKATIDSVMKLHSHSRKDVPASVF